MKQNWKESLLEACVNTLVGLCITGAFLPLVNWVVGVKMSGGQISGHVALMTVLSVVRTYFIRRFFNGNVGKFIISRNESKDNKEDYRKEIQ